MKILIQTLFFFLLVTQICFGQWYQQNSGTTKNLNAVQFVDEYTGWAVGDSGLILHTSTGGSNWVQQSSGIQLPITDVAFTDASTGWVLGRELWEFQGEHNILLKTTNGGLDWIQQINDTTCFLDAICFINQSTGWITGGRRISSDSAEIVLMKTTDGGNEWSPQSSPFGWGPSNNDFVSSHYAICFVDSNTRYIATGNSSIGSAGLIVKTTDGGETWNEQWFPLAWRDIAFTDAQNGIVVGRGVSDRWYWGVIYQTTNGGGEWQELVWENYHTFQDVYVNSSNVITVVGYNASFQPTYQAFGIILRSEDAGTSWMIQDSINNPLNGVSFIDDHTGWAVGENGTILHTTNGGVTFVDNEPTQPTEFILEQNYPNPFNSATEIQYSIPQRSIVTLKIYDILGKEIITLVNEEKDQGVYTVNFDANNLASGLYLYRIKAGSFVETKKMVLMK